MSGLLSSLNTASSALQAFSRALSAEQMNVANASTPGFAAVKASIHPIDPQSVISNTGDWIDLSSSSDTRADALFRSASSSAGASDAHAQQLGPINSVFDITGATGIVSALQQFSNAFAQLEVTPNDANLRSLALNAAHSVADSFRSAAGTLDGARQQVDQNIQGKITQINSLVSKIRDLNVQMRSHPGVNAGADATLRSTLDELSSLVDISTMQEPDGTVSVLAAGQTPLVLGDQAYTLSAGPDTSAATLYPSAAAPMVITSSSGTPVPAEISGSLGGLLDIRNNVIGKLLGTGTDPGDLNRLASGFASRVNQLLTGGVTDTGPSAASGVPVFVFDMTDAANAARTLNVDPSVTPAQLALVDPGPPMQSNGIAAKLAGLSSSTSASDLINGLSAEQLFGNIAAGIGQQLSDAKSKSTLDQTTVTTAQTNRQQQIGVSLDEEAVALTSYQRAYQASARVVSIINELTGEEVDLIK